MYFRKSMPIYRHTTASPTTTASASTRSSQQGVNGNLLNLDEVLKQFVDMLAQEKNTSIKWWGYDNTTIALLNGTKKRKESKLKNEIHHVLDVSNNSISGKIVGFKINEESDWSVETVTQTPYRDDKGVNYGSSNMDSLEPIKSIVTNKLVNATKNTHIFTGSFSTAVGLTFSGGIPGTAATTVGTTFTMTATTTTNTDDSKQSEHGIQEEFFTPQGMVSRAMVNIHSREQTMKNTLIVNLIGGIIIHFQKKIDCTDILLSRQNNSRTGRHYKWYISIEDIYRYFDNHKNAISNFSEFNDTFRYVDNKVQFYVEETRSVEKIEYEFFVEKKRMPADSILYYTSLYNVNEPYKIFTGRENDLGVLHNSFFAGESGDGNLRKTIIYGPPGIGKTQLGKQYIHAHLTDGRGPYEVIGWINAEKGLYSSYSRDFSPALLGKSIDELSVLSDIKLEVDKKLNASKSWLLVFDLTSFDAKKTLSGKDLENAAKYNYDAFIPKKINRQNIGHVIILSPKALASEGYHSHQLERFTRVNAILLLYKLRHYLQTISKEVIDILRKELEDIFKAHPIPVEDKPNHLSNILEAPEYDAFNREFLYIGEYYYLACILEDHPIALTQAMVLLRDDFKSGSIKDYIKQYDDAKQYGDAYTTIEGATRKKMKNGMGDNYGKTAQTALKITFSKIESNNAFSLTLLSALSYLYLPHISQDIILNLLNDIVSVPDADKDDVASELEKYFLIFKRNNDTQDSFYEIHRLTQKSCHAYVEKDIKVKTYQHALRAIQNAYNALKASTDSTKSLANEQVSPHLRSLFHYKKIILHINPGDVLTLLLLAFDTLNYYEYELRNKNITFEWLELIRDLLQHTTSISEPIKKLNYAKLRVYDSNYCEDLDVNSNLSGSVKEESDSLFQTKEDLDEIEATFTDASDAERQEYQLTRSYYWHQKGTLFKRDNDFSASLQAYCEALKIKEPLYVETKDPKTLLSIAYTRHGMANAFFANQEKTKAARLFEQALADKEKYYVNEPYHRNIARTRLRLGVVLMDIGGLAELAGARNQFTLAEEALKRYYDDDASQELTKAKKGLKQVEEKERQLNNIQP